MMTEQNLFIGEWGYLMMDNMGVYDFPLCQYLYWFLAVFAEISFYVINCFLFRLLVSFEMIFYKQFLMLC